MNPWFSLFFTRTGGSAMSNQDYSSSSRKASDTIQDAAHTTKDKLNKMGNKIAEQSEELLNKAEEYGDTAYKYIKKNPMKAIAIAGIAGIIIGKLLKF